MRSGRPVVALESAVITAGLPRAPLAPDLLDGLPGWDHAGDVHLEAARLLERAVRRRGAVPATVAVLDGTLRIGLEPPELERLAAAAGAEKVSSADLAWAMTGGRTAGTTVSATLAACRAADPPLQVMATGGIGGVHRGWTERPDVSADLLELSRTRCCVVCAGVKSVLDVAATAETLQALGVAVIGLGTDQLPLFYCRGGSGLPVAEVADVAQVSRLCRTRWEELRDGGSVLLVQPPPEPWAMDAEAVEALLAEAGRAAARAGVSGPDVTPFLLSELARRTGGRSVRANIAVLERNAAVAAEAAAALVCGGRERAVRK